MADVGAILSERLMAAAQVVEEQLDAELNKMEKLDEDDLEAIRRQRLANLEKAQVQKREWLKQGHGEYSEIPEEKEFFNVTKNSENVVCQFYRSETFRCKIFDKHLNILAKKHVETKFVKINAEKCPFLVERLRVKVIPTLLLVQGAKTKDYIVGFTDLGNTDEFSTAMLEWRLACSEIIKYSGDLMTPPDQGGKGKTSFIKKQQTKKIRGSNQDDSSDEDDW
uniref:Thioredoxin domain-containing protein 9 n=1 Tax=Caligus rogercresseyi TaxID=217165 RepID=C1BRL3_CALRO|nr:Thioredoxin domain-containing protein 9 [Caligus rogercresseyi]|eukprot:TRINITY_DN579_c0_g1_i1.p1 TRINITY_DN579_c0_g1~~TRINITY_DN579_c0_g1_i1.p1  ORF type:complete len:223 (-),score=91.80 TRINITY_DN579_c0_g1_i1:117-785(-)